MKFAGRVFSKAVSFMLICGLIFFEVNFMRSKSFNVKFYFVCCVLLLGSFTTSNFAQNNSQKPSPCPAEEDIERGTGMGFSFVGSSLGTSSNDRENTPIRLISKPIGKYTEEARKNCIEGVVILEITFLAKGKIGKIKVLKGLTHGLSNQAVKAAKLIKFMPEIKNGEPKTVVKKMSYNFTIY